MSPHGSEPPGTGGPRCARHSRWPVTGLSAYTESFSVATITLPPAISGSAYTAPSTEAVHRRRAFPSAGPAAVAPVRASTRWYVGQTSRAALRPCLARAALDGADVVLEAVGAGVLVAGVLVAGVLVAEDREADPPHPAIASATTAAGVQSARCRIAQMLRATQLLPARCVERRLSLAPVGPGDHRRQRLRNRHDTAIARANLDAIKRLGVEVSPRS
jgi:hypothetical protein